MNKMEFFAVILLFFCKKVIIYVSLLKQNFYHYATRSRFKQMDGYICNPQQLVGEKYISIGKNTRVEKYGIITAWDKYETQLFTPSIVIGNNCNIGERVHITACHEIVIGNNVLTGRYVFISDNSHGNSTMEQSILHPLKRPLSVKGSVIIEDNVWIGERVCILSGVTIGFGAIIAANAVVTHNVPPRVIVAGVPATIIKRL